MIMVMVIVVVVVASMVGCDDNVDYDNRNRVSR
jgi:hypothetical protein